MNATSINKRIQSWSLFKRSVLLRIFDLVFSIAGIITISYITQSNYFEVYQYKFISWLITYIVYFLLIAEVFEMYHNTKNSDILILIRNIIFTTLFTTLLFLFTPKITPHLPHSRLEVVYLFIGMTVPLFIWRYLYNNFFYKDRFLKNILFIGNSEKIMKTLSLIEKFSIEHKVVAYMSDKEIPELKDCPFYSYNSINLNALVAKYKIKIILVSNLFDEVFSVGFSGQLIQMFKKGITIEPFYEFNEKLSKRLSKNRFNDTFYNYFSISNYYQDSVYVGFIKVFDILISVFGLLVFVLIIPIIVMLNLFFNRGPLFYSQVRIGMYGDPFKIYKLRTMHVNAEQGAALWATKNDIRATSFGHFLRKTRIDEMPQFINILKGDMNIIGPRPERPEFVTMLENELPFYAMRHVVKPGLTGWAQVEYPYANSIEDQEMKLRYDLYYIKERTPILDFKIILKTINTILFYKGY